MAITVTNAANYLCGNFDGDGSSGAAMWSGGSGVFTADYQGGTGTMTLEFSVDNGVSWVTVGSDTTVTASGGGVFTLPSCQIRLTASGTASTPDIDVIVTGTGIGHN